MTDRAARVSALLDDTEQQLRALTNQAVERTLADLQATRFHLLPRKTSVPVVVILGGTGTGKSTLLNRLLDRTVSATSFRRTFTAGAVAVAGSADSVPDRWLGLDPHLVADEQLPARGEIDRLDIVVSNGQLTSAATVVDTPDIDGDQPLHHAQADRAFRWAHAVLFLVTPEKYQMTELLPYYRLTRRYAIPSLFVMNKCEEQAVLDDYREQLQSRHRVPAPIPLFAIPRDDSIFQPDEHSTLESLRSALPGVAATAPSVDGLRARVVDLASRLHDQVIEPLRNDRRVVETLRSNLRAMETPAPGVDVNPLTRALQRRMQERSVLYLMGPGRMLDRVRQVPGLLARLPRTAWDLFRHGKIGSMSQAEPPRDWSANVPDFATLLKDQLSVVQSRMDDLLRSDPSAARWVEADAQGYLAAKLPRERASAIVEEELAQLRDWLEKRWNATPRDTAILNKLLTVLPGAKHLTRYSEAAPYLLAVVVAAHHAFFGPVDLLILGGFSIATWISEKLSNEVASRTRLTNTRIADRFGKLAHEQIQSVSRWLDSRAPSSSQLDTLSRLHEQIIIAAEQLA